MSKQRLILRHQYALGDTVLLSALVRDVHAAYPGRFETEVITHWNDVWANNPHVAPPVVGGNPLVVDVSYAEGIKAAGRGEQVHMLAWYHRDFSQKTGLPVPVTRAGADLHLTSAEREPFLKGRYWLVLAGGKVDLTAKWWSPASYQAVVDRLAPFGVRFAQAGAPHDKHHHAPLRNVLNLVGRTENVRDLFGLVLHADGVLCGVTGAMHIAAALGRPCVVVAGGREEPWWEAYSPKHVNTFGPLCPPVAVPHRYLHTLGMMPCAEKKGCWKSRVVPIEPDDVYKPEKAKKLCVAPVRRPGQPAVPACLDMITPDHVVEAVLSYYADGTLPPLR